jgi:hypothetical protein
MNMLMRLFYKKEGNAMVIPILLFLVGLVLLIKGGDWFVDGATGIAHRFGLPELLIGATVVSIGTTLPEVMVSATSALSGHGEIAYGNAIGSIICNTALIAALTVAIRPGRVDRGALTLPVCFFFGFVHSEADKSAAVLLAVRKIDLAPVPFATVVVVGASCAVSVGIKLHLIFPIHIRRDLSAKLYQSPIGGVSGLSRLQRQNSRLADLPGRWKIGLADPQRDHPLHGLGNVKIFSDPRWRNRRHHGG